MIPVIKDYRASQSMGKVWHDSYGEAMNLTAVTSSWSLNSIRAVVHVEPYTPAEKFLINKLPDNG
jgi:hypothetical protein